MDALETAHLELSALKQSPGSELAGFTAALQRDSSGLEATYRGVELTGDSNTYMNSESDVSRRILRAAGVFDLKEWPQEKAEQ